MFYIVFSYIILTIGLSCSITTQVLLHELRAQPYRTFIDEWWVNNTTIQNVYWFIELPPSFLLSKPKKENYYINSAWVENKVDFSLNSLSTVLHLIIVLDSFMITKRKTLDHYCLHQLSLALKLSDGLVRDGEVTFF